MYSPSKQTISSLLAVILLVAGLTSCSPTSATNIPGTSTPTQSASHPESGICLGSHAQPPYANIQVSHDTYPAHSEPMLTEDPENPLHLVGGSKFFTDLVHYRFKIGYFTSFDGGCTWTDGGLLQGFGADVLTSDPTFAFGTNHEVYAAVLNAVDHGESGISVFTSDDGGKTFGSPVSVFTDKTGRVFSDKPWITVDQTEGPRRGVIYVVWSYDHGGDCGFGNLCSQELAFSRSTDSGKTFSRVQLIEGIAPFCTNPATGRPANATTCNQTTGAIPVVEPDGTIVVTFPYSDPMSGPIPTRMLITTSPDGGTRWTSPVLAATIHDIYGFFPPEHYRNASLPAFACDPKTGQLYLAWSDKRNGDADILLITSNDHGQTWSTPIRVNDDPRQNGANQFQPQLVVAPNGIVSISFFDTRVDPQHRRIDVYLAQSINHGSSFLKNRRVTTQSWDPEVGAPVDANGLQFIGDYQGLAADEHFVHPFWNDTRTGRQEIFTAVVPSVQPNGSKL